MLKDVNDFIKEIKLMEEKISLSLFEDFLESSSPAGYAKTLINIKNADENKETVAEKIDRISNLKDRIKEMSETKKKKMGIQLQRLLKKFLITKKMRNKFFSIHQKLIKENQNQSLKKALQRG